VAGEFVKTRVIDSTAWHNAEGGEFGKTDGFLPGGSASANA